jgi:hypothetical protein
MTRRICCVCGIQYGTKDDGRDEVVDSHGYCERHFDEVMMQIAEMLPVGRVRTEYLERKEMFAELPADGSRSV